VDVFLDAADVGIPSDEVHAEDILNEKDQNLQKQSKEVDAKIRDTAHPQAISTFK